MSEQTQRANVSEVTRSDSVVAEGVTLPVGEKPAPAHTCHGNEHMPPGPCIACKQEKAEDDNEHWLSHIKIRARRIIYCDSLDVAELAVADMIGIFREAGIDVTKSYAP